MPGSERPPQEPSAPPGVRFFEASRQRYGAPRVHADLQARGRRISKRTVAKLMKQNGIRPPRGKRRVPITTDSRHAHAVAPNLLDRNFEIAVPDTVWLADISYIPTDEGWLYLAAVKDLATMEIVGWSMSDRLKSTVCEDEDGHPQPAAAEGSNPPLRPRGSVCLRRLPQAARGKWHHSLDEQKGELPARWRAS